MKRLYLLFTTILLALNVSAQNFVLTQNDPGAFPLATPHAAAIYIDGNDNWLVNKVALLLQTDIERVTGEKPPLITDLSAAPKNVIIIGTINGSSIIQKL